MDCPKCGTWNPDDKDVCWRCQTELPKPLPEKKKDPANICRISDLGLDCDRLLLRRHVTWAVLHFASPHRMTARRFAG